MSSSNIIANAIIEGDMNVYYPVLTNIGIDGTHHNCALSHVFSHLVHIIKQTKKELDAERVAHAATRTTKDEYERMVKDTRDLVTRMEMQNEELRNDSLRQELEANRQELGALRQELETVRQTQHSQDLAEIRNCLIADVDVFRQECANARASEMAARQELADTRLAVKLITDELNKSNNRAYLIIKDLRERLNRTNNP